MTQDEIFDAVRRLAAEHGGETGCHDFFRALHRVVLHGMGFNNDATISGSGEQGVLRYVQAEMGRRGSNEFIVFDVGANMGEYSRAVLEICTGATVYAFEPSPTAFGRLQQAVTPWPGRCRAFNLGFSDAPGESRLFADSPGSRMGSLYHRDLGPHGAVMTAGEAVRLEALDSFCDQVGVERINFLKIDVEGHEVAVLKGASRLLERRAIDFIQFEFGGCNIDSRTFLRDFWRILEGFTICRILKDGIYQFKSHGVVDEIFSYQNLLAIRR